MQNHLSSKGPRSHNKVLLLPEGSEALRAGLGVTTSGGREREESQTSVSELSPALGAFTPQPSAVTSGCQLGRQGAGKTGMAQGFYPFDCRPVSP